MKHARIWFALALTIGLAGSALANPFSPSPFSEGNAYAPTVPVSAFATPSAWFDPSRLHISTSVSFGTGWGGGAASGLQVTNLSYQVSGPLSLRVGVGNTFGGGNSLNGRGGMFLEGFQVAYRPSSMFQINVQYQDVRSPLQLSPYAGYSTFGR
jgi:hypothetical protein